MSKAFCSQGLTANVLQYNCVKVNAGDFLGPLMSAGALPVISTELRCHLWTSTQGFLL